VVGAALVLVAAIGSSVPGSAASPNQGPAPTPGPAARHVVSDDGQLVLDVPMGSHPDVDSLELVRVAAVVPSIAAYELLPAGTTFQVPVTATWRPDPVGMPGATDGDLAWLGMAQAADPVAGPWEWLADPHLDVVNGSYSISGRLTWFGTLVVTLQDTRIHGPEAIWGPGYELPNGEPVILDMTLVPATGARGTATFSGEWRFGGGYPDRIRVEPTVSEVERLTATWQCLRTSETSLETTFGLKEIPIPIGSMDNGSLGHAPGLGPAAAAVTVAFPVQCGVRHPGTNP
jgi:hypothetical protein